MKLGRKSRRITALIAAVILSMGADGGCDPKGDPTQREPNPAPADPKPKRSEKSDDEIRDFQFTGLKDARAKIVWGLSGALKTEIVQLPAYRTLRVPQTHTGAIIGEVTIIGEGRVNCKIIDRATGAPTATDNADGRNVKARCFERYI